ncbi:hypothetical protein M493_10372 [Geobacillus genomosp. 3]|uniref:Uncharacterized protein n=1 Tax=Geobacillus genomosp. 3 TaxID=1921421 RepID=V5LYH1_GEOG3|nr:hypothetical protein M493_10372 [Geobacillus genomosp. 3]
MALFSDSGPLHSMHAQQQEGGKRNVPLFCRALQVGERGTLTLHFCEQPLHEEGIQFRQKFITFSIACKTRAGVGT